MDFFPEGNQGEALDLESELLSWMPASRLEEFNSVIQPHFSDSATSLLSITHDGSEVSIKVLNDIVSYFEHHRCWINDFGFLFTYLFNNYLLSTCSVPDTWKRNTDQDRTKNSLPQGPLIFWWWKQHKTAKMEFKIRRAQEPNMSAWHQSRRETNTCRYLRARGPDTWCCVREGKTHRQWCQEDNAGCVGSFPSASWVTVGAWALLTIWLRAPGKCELRVTCYDKRL